MWQYSSNFGCKDSFLNADNHFMSKPYFSKIIVFLFIILNVLSVSAQRGEKIRTIVIDAGHGGKDPGAVGKISKEKDINLAVALKLGGYIKEYLPDVKVIYTRDKDVFVTLSERAAIANRNSADVFISIHCNATAKNSNVAGTEVFVMGEHKNAANLEVAKLENSAILYEDNADEEYGFDLESPEAYIALTLFQSEFQSRSLDLAARLDRQFIERVGRKSRGVQPGPFLVLVRTSMPSILVELGFLTNVAEEKFLASKDGQVYMASALYRAFRDYKVAYEKENEAVEKEIVQEPQPAPDSIAYKVQFASRDKKTSVNDRAFRKLKQVEMYEQNGSYKYTSGVFATKEEAIAHQSKVKALGYKDAFVVAFCNGQRVTLKEAETLQSKRK